MSFTVLAFFRLSCIHDIYIGHECFLCFFFTISNWHLESAEKNELLLHIAFINITVQ